MKRFLFLILLLFHCQAIFAQEEFIEPSRMLSRFRFSTLTGGVILLKGQVAPFPDTLNFIFDTGSGGISLDSVTAENFGLVGTPSNRTIRGIAGIKNVSFIYNKTLQLPGLTIDSLNFHINDYYILEAVYGLKIDGIMGYSVLNRYIIHVDYDQNIIEFWSKGSMKYPKGGFMLRPIINTIPIQHVEVRDHKTVNARFLYDMGAGLNLMLSTDFIKDSNILHKSRKMYTKEAEGLGGKIDMQMTVVKQVRIGPYRFRNVPVYVFNDDYNITSYPYLGGLLGNDLLRRFNVILNYERKEVYLVPNSHFGDAFDYSYSGLELYFIDGRIIIGDVAVNSPASASGLIEGDIVVAVNKNFNQNLQQYKANIQNAGQRVRIIVLRDGELREFEFKVKSILK